MKIFFFILICFVFSRESYAQFDSSGFRFLCRYDKDNTNQSTKFTDTNFYLLRNTGKANTGLILESYNLVDDHTYSIHFLFDPSYRQRTVSRIGIEQFAYKKGKLALLSNQGIYYTECADQPLKLLSSEITAFEYDDLELDDSMLYIYRNSHKTYGPFLDIVSLNIQSGHLTQLVLEQDINSSVYANFRDTRLVDCSSGNLVRADYVLPVCYRYGTKTDTLFLLCDSSYASKIIPYIIPDELIGFMHSYATNTDLEYLDTTIKLNHSFYANRYMSINKQGDKLVLLASYPGPSTGFNPQYILSEWSISTPLPTLESLIKIESVRNMAQPIRHAFDVINPWGIIHMTWDESYYYFVVRNATQLHPAGKTLSEYNKSNYPLQFENTGFAVIRLLK